METLLCDQDFSATPGAPAIRSNFATKHATGAAEETHELRVRIPGELHRQLLSLKVLRGRTLAETVSLALDAYFAQVRLAPKTAAAADPG